MSKGLYNSSMSKNKKYTFEDFTPGTTFNLGPYQVSAEEIIAFASEFDPQPMHLDEEAGKQSLLGGLAASGWHTCCMLMRMMIGIGVPGRAWRRFCPMEKACPCRRHPAWNIYGPVRPAIAIAPRSWPGADAPGSLQSARRACCRQRKPVFCLAAG